MEIGEAKSAIKDAKEWLKSARLMKENGLYGKAVYALEMSLEIAMKAVLIATHKDFPKKHDISDLLEDAVLIDKKKFPNKFVDELDEMKSVFSDLLRLRNIGGYSFRSGSAEGLLKKEAADKIDSVEKFVDLCEKAVDHLTDS